MLTYSVQFTEHNSTTWSAYTIVRIYFGYMNGWPAALWYTAYSVLAFFLNIIVLSCCCISGNYIFGVIYEVWHECPLMLTWPCLMQVSFHISPVVIQNRSWSVVPVTIYFYMLKTSPKSVSEEDSLYNHIRTFVIFMGTLSEICEYIEL
jgi:hypothetical protein